MATNTLSVRTLRDPHPKALAIARAFRRIKGERREGRSLRQKGVVERRG